MKLTRDEILTIPEGREMDAAVAEVMGCKIAHIGFGNLLCGCKDERHGLCDRDSGFMAIIPNYSTDIAAAFRLLQKTFRAFSVEQKVPDSWAVWCKMENGKYVLGVGNTAPLAICRAFLSRLHCENIEVMQ